MNSKLTDAATLKRILPLVVAAYRDYRNYWGELGLLAENFDESLEHFDNTTWRNLIFGLGKNDTDDYAMNCIDSLDETISAFSDIIDEAERGLIILLKATLALPTEKQKQVFNRAFKIESQQVDKLIEQMFEAFDEVEYKYNVEENFEVFLQLIDRVWVDYLVDV